MKKLIIAEKPSVGRELAIFVKALDDKKTHFENDEYIITWARGHLLQLSLPNVYGFDYSLNSLPMLPTKFLTQTDPSSVNQLNSIVDLINKCNEIIVATDAGREGELIFRYIYDYSKSNKKFKRLWLQSLTTEGIAEAFTAMKDGSAYENLYQSGYSRAKADWLYGMNLTRAFTLINQNSNKQISAGRVKSPTLCIIAKRYDEHKNFQTKNFFYPSIEIKSDNAFVTLLKSDQRFDSQEESDKHVAKLTNVNCESYNKGEVFERTPLLFSLNDLQIIANKKYGYSPTETLEYAQKLYESQYITYPRSDSRHLTVDMIPQVLTIISTMKTCKDSVIAKLSQSIGYSSNAELEDHKIFDNSQVSDHYGIIPLYKYEKLDHHEGIIFNLIVERFLQAFSEDAIFTTVKASFKFEELSFVYNSRVVKKEGFKIINLTPKAQSEDDTEELQTSVFEFTTQKQYDIQNPITAKGVTAPAKLHTVASLLAIMDNPKNLVENELYKPKNKGFTLGTPATRASIIEQLLKKDETITIKGKNLIPTEFGLNVYNVIKHYDFSKTDMTAEWEFKLLKIAEGSYSSQTFDNEIFESIKKVVEEIKTSKININDSNAQPCPKCKSGALIDKGQFYSCSNRSESLCDFSFSKEKGGVAISLETIKEIIANGRTKKKQNFKSKEGKSFDAQLAFDIDFKIVYVFNESIGKCPKCKNGELSISNKWLNCSTENCTKLYTEQFGKELTAKEILKLLGTKKIDVKGFYSQSKQKNFDATLILFEEDGKLKTKLEFPKTEPKKV